MKNDTEPTNTQAADLVCEILTHGIIIDGSHHAAGKQLTLPKAKADALLNLSPPAVKVIGVS